MPHNVTRPHAAPAMRPPHDESTHPWSTNSPTALSSILGDAGDKRMAQLRQSSKHFACKLAGRTLTDRRQAHQWCPSSTSHRSPKARPSSVTSGSRFVGDGTGVWWLRKSKRVNRPAGKRSQSPSRQPLPHSVTIALMVSTAPWRSPAASQARLRCSQPSCWRHRQPMRTPG